MPQNSNYRPFPLEKKDKLLCFFHHSLDNLPSTRLATAENHSTIFFFYSIWSADILSWMHLFPVHSFTLSTHCGRSQWSSSNMSDCSARGPGIECCGQLCLSHNHCDVQSWARAVCTLPAVPRSTQPSTLRGTVNEYQLSGWVIIINGDGGCRR